MMNQFKKVDAIQTTDTSNLVKETDYSTEINEMEKKITNHDHDKYITTQEFNKLAAQNTTARSAKTNLGREVILMLQ